MAVALVASSLTSLFYDFNISGFMDRRECDRLRDLSCVNAWRYLLPWNLALASDSCNLSTFSKLFSSVGDKYLKSVIAFSALNKCLATATLEGRASIYLTKHSVDITWKYQ